MCHASTGRFPQPLRWGGQPQLYPNQRGLQSVRPPQEKPSASVTPGRLMWPVNNRNNCMCAFSSHPLFSFSFSREDDTTSPFHHLLSWALAFIFYKQTENCKNALLHLCCDPYVLTERIQRNSRFLYEINEIFKDLSVYFCEEESMWEENKCLIVFV